MMPSGRLVFVAVAAVLVAGCAPRVAFVRPDATPAMHSMDSSRCEYEIEMAQRGIDVPWYYNNRQALGYTIGAAIGSAIRNDRLRALCMQSKGYSPVPLAAAGGVDYSAPLVSMPGAAPPVAYAQTVNQTASPGRGDMIPTAPPTVAATPAVAGLKGESKYFLTAEGIAKVSGCAPPSVAMTAKGAGSESFMVGCPNGTTMAIRCEVDGCRILR